MRKLSELSLADLLGLYNNYIIVQTTNCGSAWSVISETKCDAVEIEIETRISNIDFTNE